MRSEGQAKGQGQAKGKLQLQLQLDPERIGSDRVGLEEMLRVQ